MGLKWIESSLRICSLTFMRFFAGECTKLAKLFSQKTANVSTHLTSACCLLFLFIDELAAYLTSIRAKTRRWQPRHNQITWRQTCGVPQGWRLSHCGKCVWMNWTLNIKKRNCKNQSHVHTQMHISNNNFDISSTKVLTFQNSGYCMSVWTNRVFAVWWSFCA